MYDKVARVFNYVIIILSFELLWPHFELFENNSYYKNTDFKIYLNILKIKSSAMYEKVACVFNYVIVILSFELLLSRFELFGNNSYYKILYIKVEQCNEKVACVFNYVVVILVLNCYDLALSCLKTTYNIQMLF